MSPSAPPAPWGRSATKPAGPLPPHRSPQKVDTAGAVPKFHSRSLVGSIPDRHTHSKIHNTVPFLDIRMHYLCPGAPPPPGLDWVSEARNLPLLCSGDRGAGKPGLCHCRRRPLGVSVVCKFCSIHGMPCPSLAWGPPSARNHVVSLLMGQLCQSHDFFRDLMQMVLQFNS